MPPRLDRLDGAKHINIYSKGKTILGRLLDNSADTPFECDDGPFRSINGYKWWLITKDENFRTLYGYQVKEYSRHVKIVNFLPEYTIIKKILKAINIKINSHDKIKNLLMESTLPFKSYKIEGNKAVDIKRLEPFIEEIERIRKELKQCLSGN